MRAASTRSYASTKRLVARVLTERRVRGRRVEPAGRERVHAPRAVTSVHLHRHGAGGTAHPAATHRLDLGRGTP